jgi:type IV pilus biogenesis protein CpaD/CtpE
MRSSLVLLALLAYAASACARHPTYGQPMPQDTVSTTKMTQPEVQPPQQEPGSVPN